MMEKLKDLVRTRTLRQSLITVIGTGTSGVFGFLFFWYAANSTSSAEYALFAISITLVNLFADIGDIGLNTGIIRFVAKYRGEDVNRTNQFLKLIFKLKIIIWIVIITLSFVSARYIAEHIFNKPEIYISLLYAGFGVGGIFLLGFALNTIQASSRFVLWSISTVFINFFRLLILVILSIWSINSNILTNLYIAIPFIGFIFLYNFLPNFWVAKSENSQSKELFSFTKWVAVSIGLSAIVSRIDILLATRFVSLSELGVYAVAIHLTSLIPQVVYAIAVVVAPKMSSYEDKVKAKRYINKVQIFVFGLAIIGIMLGVPIGYIVIRYAYAEHYYLSFIPYVILLIGQAIFLLSIPAHTAISFYFAKPKILVAMNMVNLIVISIGGVFLVSNFGILGASINVLVFHIIEFLIPTVWVYYQFRNKK